MSHDRPTTNDQRPPDAHSFILRPSPALSGVEGSFVTAMYEVLDYDGL